MDCFGFNLKSSPVYASPVLSLGTIYQVPATQSLPHECRGPGKDVGASQDGFHPLLTASPSFSQPPQNMEFYLPTTVKTPFTALKPPRRRRPFIPSLLAGLSFHCAPPSRLPA